MTWPILGQGHIWSQTFLWEKVKNVDFSQTIAACELEVGRCSILNE